MLLEDALRPAVHAPSGPGGARMRHLRIRLDRSALRRWHLRLFERLALRGDVRVSVEAAPAAGLPAQAELLFRLEAMIFGLPRPGLATPVEPDRLDRLLASGRDGPAAGEPDLVLDLCGGVARDGPPVWRLDFDGIPGEAGLLAAAFSGRAPVAALRAPGATVAAGRLGTEMQSVALASFEDYLARTITLILAALDGAASPTLPTGGVVPVSPPQDFGLGAAAAAGRIAEALARQVVRRLHALCFHGPHWRVGWRRIDGPDLIDLRRHPAEGWINLPDDGGRFYADPFPIRHAGAVVLFVEEFEHRRGKGIISALRFGPEGPLGRPEPVLERDHHLSYPFVFEREGAVWMIPESSAAGTIDLYRATAFPGGWVHEAVLVEGIAAGDATLVRHGGLWWMLATVRVEGGCHSDALHLWSAADFRGPWTAHAGNPVLIDVGSARSAGRIVRRDGALIRPVQDCRDGYGTALGLARILRLDASGFEQVVETTLRPGPAWPGRRLHMLNTAGGLEFVDGSSRTRDRFFGV